MYVRSEVNQAQKIDENFGYLVKCIFSNKYKLFLSFQQAVSWCSWLSHQSNTLKVSSSSLDETILFSHYLFLIFLFNNFNRFHLCCLIDILSSYIIMEVFIFVFSMPVWQKEFLGIVMLYFIYNISR